MTDTTSTPISDGAEAVVFREDGIIVKERQNKSYRHPQLDERLRKDRTRQEQRLLEKAYQAGVRVPSVEQRDDVTLELEEITGDLLKDVLADRLDLCATIGDSIARLHNNDIIHGDLTTSNMIVADEARSTAGSSGGTRPEGSVRDDEVYFIDFGLGFHSQRVEDRAIDLHLLNEVLDSTHTAVADEAMDRILDAYREQCENADQVLERYEGIAERGRYK